MVHDGHEDIRSEKQDGPLEPWRRHAKDGEWMPVEPNNAAHHGAIIPKMAVPICVGEHDIRRAVWAVLIGSVEETAKVRLNAQCVEVVSAGFVFPDIGWIFARVQPSLRDGPSSHIVEAAIALAKIEIVRIGVGPDVAPMLDYEKALCLRHIQRTQDERIQYAEDDCVGADGQRQCQNGSDGEAGRLAQLAQCKSHIGPDRFQPRPLPHLPAALLKQRPVAESSPRCPRRFFGTHPIAHQLLGTLFNVQANLFGEIFVELTAAENLRNPVHWRFLSAGPINLLWLYLGSGPVRCPHTCAQSWKSAAPGGA